MAEVWMMPRYIRQRDNFSDRPIALMNAQKWAGMKVSYADLQTWRDACQVSRRWSSGANPVKMARLARTMPFAVRLRCRVTLADIDTQLKSGGLVILNSITPFMDGLRWFLIIGKVGQKGEPSYRVVNFDRRATVRLVSAKMIKEGMRKMDGYKGYTYALFLRKR
jgi:hypothetical protein